MATLQERRKEKSYRYMSFNLKLMYYMGTLLPNEIKENQFVAMLRRTIAAAFGAFLVFQLCVSHVVDMVAHIDDANHVLENIINMMLLAVTLSRFLTFYVQSARVTSLVERIDEMHHPSQLVDDFERSIVMNSRRVLKFFNMVFIGGWGVFSCLFAVVTIPLSLWMGKRLSVGYFPYADSSPGFELLVVALGVQIPFLATMAGSASVFFGLLLVLCLNQLKILTYRIRNIKTLAEGKVTLMTEERLKPGGRSSFEVLTNRRGTVSFQHLALLQPLVDMEEGVIKTERGVPSQAVCKCVIQNHRGAVVLQQLALLRPLVDMEEGRIRPVGGEKRAVRMCVRHNRDTRVKCAEVKSSAVDKARDVNIGWERKGSDSRTVRMRVRQDIHARVECAEVNSSPVDKDRDLNIGGGRKGGESWAVRMRARQDRHARVECAEVNSSPVDKDRDLNIGGGRMGSESRAVRMRARQDRHARVECAEVNSSPVDKDRDVEVEMARILSVCVEQHYKLIRFIADVSSTFNPMLITQLMMNVGATAFMANVLSSGRRDAFAAGVVGILFAITAELFIMSLITASIEDEGMNISQAAYDCDWLQSSKQFKKSIGIIMTIANRPLVLRTAGFIVISLPMFSFVMRKAYDFIKFMDTAIAS